MMAQAKKYGPNVLLFLCVLAIAVGAFGARSEILGRRGREADAKLCARNLQIASNQRLVLFVLLERGGLAGDPRLLKALNEIPNFDCSRGS